MKRALAVLLALVAVMGVTAQPAELSEPERAAVREYLRGYLSTVTRGAEPSASFSASATDLDGDGANETVVLLSNSLLVLQPAGRSYRVVSRTPQVYPPVRLLPTRTAGWRDLSARMSGGAIVRDYQAHVTFRRGAYVKEPQMRIAQTEGTVLVSRNAAEYPVF